MSFIDFYKNLFTLNGKVAMVAGGTGGIGHAIAEGLAAFGARIAITDTTARQEYGEIMVSQLSDKGVDAQYFSMDICQTCSLHSLVDSIAAKMGVPDILINAIGTHKETAAKDVAEDEWDRIMDVNLKGAFFLSQAVTQAQIARGGGGKHIHITSVRSVLALRGRGYAAYCSSKGGLSLMVKQLAMEWAEYCINVNAIGPTFTRTDLVKNYLEDPNFYNPLVARIPLGRICEPHDIAALAVYLASPAADFVTGQNFLLDGGLSASQ
jgi:NAD(P)-dependent dehydrogenase (short-subunit alcohol dehydrogenase family)